MATSRREFLRLFGAAGTAGAACASVARASSGPGPSEDSWGMLTDLSLCIGCRKCEFACKQANGLDPKPIEEFEDQSVFQQRRRPDSHNLTVVNRYAGLGTEAKPVHVKKQCMHCNQPACASACPVAAIRKKPQGPVTYDASLCIGCRYCVMACPFSMPAYTYEIALAPVVRKCTMCFERVSKDGGVPACAKICPVEAVTFGTRGKLLELARKKIRNHPDRYVDHIYGEHEAGGTAWLYVAPMSFEKLGFRTDLGSRPYPELTSGFLSIVPLVATIWPAVLLSAYALTKPRGHSKEAKGSESAGGHDAKVVPHEAAPTSAVIEPKPQPEHPSKGA